MLKTLLFFIITLNVAFAGRFEEADKKKFINDVKLEIAQHKLENKGFVDLQIIKPEFYQGLDELFTQEKITKDEMITIKQRYENFSREKVNNTRFAEATFYNFLEKQLDEINQRPLPKTKEGQICNNWSCDTGLKCAPDPVQDYGNQCKSTGLECKSNNDCCSNECVENPNTNKKTCEDVYRCFKPLDEGKACVSNPVCGVGACLPFDANAGMGECENNLKACKSNDDCCSNLCGNGVCQPNFICKDCVGRGKSAERGKKCCEGLMLNESGICVPDVPPLVNHSPLKKVLIGIVSLFISNADAQTDTHQINSSLQVEESLRSFTAGSKEDCVKSISEVLEGRTGTCTLGGGCGVSCGKPGASCASANPTFYGLCAKASELGYLPGFEPKTAEEVAVEEEAFLTKQNDVVNSDIVSTIKDNADKYGYGFQGKSDTLTTKDSEKKALTLARSSNFDTCEIRFKDDFMTYLSKNNLLQLEMALLGFDFVMSGEGVNDYWTTNGSPNTSIYARLKDASKLSKEQRAKLWDTIEKTNNDLTCMCLDAKGLKNIKLESKKEYFIKSCAEYAKYLDPNVKQDTLDGDASGLKAKKLLVTWTSKLAEFNKTIVVEHGELKMKVNAVLTHIGDDQIWSKTETKTYPLFNFNIKNPSGSSAALGAVLGAILAAGVIAIMGGFGTASILTAWGVTGIIAVSAVTGAGGLWMISSLRGAWITKKPEIMDKYVRSYGCGKKETCVEYARELIQPHNTICNMHISANGCVKDFMVIREKVKKNSNTALTEESVFLIDPWVPYKVPASMLIKDSLTGLDYATRLDRGFIAAKAAMISKNPQASGGGGKKGGGEFVPESYLSEVFLDPALVGQYVPQLGDNIEPKYFLRDNDIQVIKKAAIEFAIDQKFFEAGDTANLKIFSDYVYEYHFLYPKRAKLNEISYPTVGLKNYIDLMVNSVLSNLAAGAAKAVGNANSGFTNTNLRYLEDYQTTLGLYSDTLNQSDAVKKAALKKEIDLVGNEIDRLKLISTLLAPANDSVASMNKAITDASGIGGGKGAMLTAGDKAYLGAVGKLRADKKDQLKKYEKYKKAIATSGNKARAERMLKAASKFNAKFTRPISTANGGSGFGSDLAGKVNDAEASAVGSNGDANANANGMNGAGGLGLGADAFANVAPFGSSAYGSSSSSSSKTGYGMDNSRSRNNNGMGSGGMSEEDRKRLADAIDARNRANAEKYQSNDGQSLFEKVTNAYIRNYDKVLSKKKDKDVLESK